MILTKAGHQRMADHSQNGLLERDIEQAIIALKKGAQLLKYGRRGKPKFCPFRLSADECALIWYSGKEEKKLWLSTVSRIVPGQRTAIFQRHPWPEKEYQSFSLLHDNEQHSVDLICKDKDEAEVWFVGLEAAISRAHLQTPRFHSEIEDAPSFGSMSPYLPTRKSSPLISRFDSTDILHQGPNLPELMQPTSLSHSSTRRGEDTFKILSPISSPHHLGIDRSYLAGGLITGESRNTFLETGSVGGSMHSSSSDMGSDSMNANMRLPGGGLSDNYRISMSSAVSSSSQGSGHEEADALGDVFMWGEGVGDGILGGGVHRIGIAAGRKLDALLPKPLEATVVLDVQYIACGARHAALVTKQGEVFSWGEESGGRLGHGVDCDIAHPQLVDALAATNIELVSCGEYHTCAVTLSGDLYTWGDGTYNFGLLGHGNDISHWMPKRVNGPLEGIRVSSIACGPWHTVLVTSAGQLFTFGDGTFGVLGHGDRKSASVPREVESLKGLKTVRAACGVWHTAAVVEVMVGYSSASNCSSGKLFTWGDGDQGRLGHGDKEQQLVPTCVAAVVDHNFRQVACGNSLTVALTTSGQVFTMGSTTYGQLGDPQADGKVPGLVGGRLWEAYVEDISCGAHHVAVLTHKSEVYTWGKGANGRLGHGDTEDRNSPTLVGTLKDKQVKSIACGVSFTAAICLHKWPSGADHLTCSGCRQPFGFTRKRHNCYNCGLAFCHACSSKKALKAALAPNPSKPYRVCDSCYSKVKKATGTGGSSVGILSRRGTPNQRAIEAKEISVKSELKLPRPQPLTHKYSNGFDTFKQIEGKLGAKRMKRPEAFSSRVSPAPNGFLSLASWGSVNVPTTFKSEFKSSHSDPKASIVSSISVPAPRAVSRAVSPLSRKASPPRSTTPTPTISGLTTSKTIVEELKKTNEGLIEENLKLRSQIESMTHQFQIQEKDVQRSQQQLQNAISMATDEAVKSRAAKEVIKSLTAQLKEMAERLPMSGFRHGRLGSMSAGQQDSQNGVHSMVTPQMLAPPDGEGIQSGPQRNNVSAGLANVRDVDVIGVGSPHTVSSPHSVLDSFSVGSPRTASSFTGTEDDLGGLQSRPMTAMRAANGFSEGDTNGLETVRQNDDGATTVGSSFSSENGRVAEAEWVEQDEPGVYITLTSLQGGGRDLKRVRFSRKRFSEKEAEQWWAENRVRVHEQYNVRGGVDRVTNTTGLPSLGAGLRPGE